ncbi:MAG: plasmid replication initiator TrfA [Pirellulales bacterium]|nr:plasmid replication initiator TrfA [Pirellulales bacterium]
MNLIEFPFGPISTTTGKTLEVEHATFDRRLKREVTRTLIITGSDKWGLPRPIDDQVLLGMKALTYEAGCVSPKIAFSRYRLCQVIGWPPDGRAYRRLEESLDRIAATTLKFKNAWWDKGEKQYKSKTFHLITEVEICNRDQLDLSRVATGRSEQQLCTFTWTEVIWKSFQDGFIRTLDMQLFRRIAQGRRREVPLRLFRVLDKRFYHAPVAKFDLRRLCIGTLGLCPNYSPSQMIRVLDRAGKWLTECGYLQEVWYTGQGKNIDACFRKRITALQRPPRNLGQETIGSMHMLPHGVDRLKTWIKEQCEADLWRYETDALASAFGSELERSIVTKEREQGLPVLSGGRTRLEYVRRYYERQVETLPSAAVAS